MRVTNDYSKALFTQVPLKYTETEGKKVATVAAPSLFQLTNKCQS